MRRSLRTSMIMALAITACDDVSTPHPEPLDDVPDVAEWLDPAQQAALVGMPTPPVLPPFGGQPGLEPGQPVELAQDVPINLVFIGYEPDEIDPADVMAGLPETSVPRARYPGFYGGGRPLGLSFSFDYEAYWADEALEDALFEHLAQSGQEGEATAFQQLYNAQQANLVDVDPAVLYIDAAETEAWLADHLHQVVPGERDPGYTVYFVNWYGRPDFRFHVYGRPGQADPDTGYPFGDLSSRQIIGWGGSHHRGWFLDLSAGPEAWTSNWMVDSDDVDGDGLEDYRLPPVWEYAEGGYRDPSDLADDLGLVTRFVALDLLFTASPLFDPMATAPGLGGHKVVHIEVLEDDGDPAASGADIIDEQQVLDAFEDFQPYHHWDAALEVEDPIDEGAAQALRTFSGVEVTDGCWTDYGVPFLQLGCYFSQNLAQYVPAYGARDTVAEVFAFNTTDATMGDYFGVLGFADDNLVDGTQTHVYEFATPSTVAWGYGLTQTTIHELGHHHGLSHPHDGYDPELDLDFGPSASFYFAWLGSHSDTVMHYLDLSNDFGVFDRDNLYRAETAGHLARATESLELLDAWAVDHPTPLWVTLFEAAAQGWARAARQRFDDWEHLPAVASARVADSLLLVVRDALGLEPAPISTLVEPGLHPPLTCDVRMPGV